MCLKNVFFLITIIFLEKVKSKIYQKIANNFLHFKCLLFKASKHLLKFFFEIFKLMLTKESILT